jgi:lysyl-tRNA synthetase class 2
MDFTEKMLEKVAVDIHGTTEVTVGDKTISFKATFKRISIFDAIKEETGIDISQMDETGLREVCAKLGIHTENSMGKGKLVDEIFGAKCEGKCIQPTFIIDYPVEMSPLTKMHRTKKGLVERFELMINGKELANAYNELNDPLDQRSRFEEQVKLMERGDDEAMFIDQDFLRSLEYGMPPTAGIGIGIDRLCMIMTNSPSIQDVLLFPQMRPEVVKKAAVVLSADEQKVLEEVKKQNQGTVASVSEATGISKNQLNKILTALTEKNMVKREGPIFQVVNQ